MKKFSLGLIAIVIAGGTIFYACKKENKLETSNVKLQKTMEGEDNLKAYEYYTPGESEMQENLLSFANCVNYPQEYAMPNMALKEAIWLMEAFFNIGLCEKQKYFADQFISKKNYQIIIPFEGEGNNISINGAVFQERYSGLLQNVVQDICPEFALDFGDVYVSRIDYASQTLTLGMDVLYGTKGEDIFDRLGRKKIIDPNQAAELHSQPGVFNFSNFYHYNQGPDSWIARRTLYSEPLYLRDPTMEKILNNCPLYRSPMNIIHDTTLTMGLSFWDYNVYEFIHESYALDDPMSGKTPSYFISDYEYYATKYRDYIYNDLYSNIPSSYSPLYACCFFLLDPLPSSPLYCYWLWQDFGIEYICQFFNPDLLTAVRATIQYEHPYAQAYLIP
jgi:hypothetical protein